MLLGFPSVAPPVWSRIVATTRVGPAVGASVVAVLAVLIGHWVVEVAVVATSSPALLLLLLLLWFALLTIISGSKARVSKSARQRKDFIFYSEKLLFFYNYLPSHILLHENMNLFINMANDQIQSKDDCT